MQSAEWEQTLWPELYNLSELNEFELAKPTNIISLGKKQQQQKRRKKEKL